MSQANPFPPAGPGDPDFPPQGPPPPKPLPPLRLWHLLVGLPALVLGLAAVGSLSFQNRKTLLSDYEAEATQALQRNDLEAALVSYKRLVMIDPTRADFRLSLAMVLDRLGDPARAEALVRTLAPLDPGLGDGYPPAHLWLGRRLIAGGDRSPGRVRQAEMHLQRYLKADPQSSIARLTLGALYATTGRPAQARPLIESFAPGNPGVLVDLAKICMALGDREEARRHATAALEAARRIAQENPGLLEARILWGTASGLLGDYPAGLELLRQAETPANRDQVARAMAGLCFDWDVDLLASRAKPADRLAVLERGLSYQPGNAVLLDRMAELVNVGGTVADRVRARLDAMLAEGRAPALIHFALGNDAWNRGQKGDARRHWEESLKAGPLIPLAANNLAWDLAFDDPKEPSRALEVVDRALASNPYDPRLRGTRGQVLGRLGRWREAVSELEAAASSGPIDLDVCNSLADAYDRVGRPDRAAEVRKRIPAVPPPAGS